MMFSYRYDLTNFLKISLLLKRFGPNVLIKTQTLFKIGHLRRRCYAGAMFILGSSPYLLTMTYRLKQASLLITINLFGNTQLWNKYETSEVYFFVH